MGRIVERSQELLASAGRLGALRLLHHAASCSSRSTTRSRVIGKAGIGTPHMDGNTRLCTATAAAALKASFGTDGQPGSYTDVDHCDAIALWGHNVAETQAVLWMRMLDRRRGTDPPRMLCVDPRDTPVAREADVHLAAARRHQPGADERAAPRADRARLDRRGLRRRAHPRLRRAASGRSSRTRRARAPRSATSPRGRSSAAAELVGTCRAAALDGAAGLLPVATRRRRRRARSTTCTCCAA